MRLQPVPSPVTRSQHQSQNQRPQSRRRMVTGLSIRLVLH
jgi:hypothetical protein